MKGKGKFPPKENTSPGSCDSTSVGSKSAPEFRTSTQKGIGNKEYGRGKKKKKKGSNPCVRGLNTRKDRKTDHLVASRITKEGGAFKGLSAEGKFVSSLPGRAAGSSRVKIRGQKGSAAGAEGRKTLWGAHRDKDRNTFP